MKIKKKQRFRYKDEALSLPFIPFSSLSLFHFAKIAWNRAFAYVLSSMSITRFRRFSVRLLVVRCWKMLFYVCTVFVHAIFVNVSDLFFLFFFSVCFSTAVACIKSLGFVCAVYYCPERYMWIFIVVVVFVVIFVFFLLVFVIIFQVRTWYISCTVERYFASSRWRCQTV